MDLRPLGRTGMLVSPIGLGTVKIGRDRGVKYPRPFEIPDDAAAAALLGRAADLGVNVLDTAPAYGASEARLGALLAAGAGGGRDRWVLCTKAGEEFDAATGASTYDFSPAAITASVERSLRRLRTDRLDAVLLHCDERDEWTVRESGAVEALESLRRAGAVRVIGASMRTVEGGLAAVERCDVVMVTYNRGDPSQRAVIDAARARGVGVLVKKGLASGHAADDAPAAVRFALACPGVGSLIVGTINPAHLEECVRAAEGAGAT